MHIEQVRFDKVFDVHAARGDFSFESRGQCRYAVNLRRGMIPHTGSSYLVALAEPGDWSTVLGWLDLQARTSALKEPTWLTVASGIGSLLWLGPFFLAGALLLGGPGAALAVLLAICAFAALRLYQVVERNRRIRHALMEAHPSNKDDHPRRADRSA